MKSIILITCLLQTALAAPQFITFKDGKVGVNFLGYHAAAGLGGGQSQNGGLLGGLHASAGTPWGQNAAAGLGGNVNGRSAGVLYAGAQASPDVGASTVLGGDTSKGGIGASEAHANGKVATRTRTVVAADTSRTIEPAPQVVATKSTTSVNAIQKIRPPKKYYSKVTHRPVRRQLVVAQPAQLCDATKEDCNKVRSQIVNSSLQIPIGILQSLQQSLGNFGSASVKGSK